MEENLKDDKLKGSSATKDETVSKDAAQTKNGSDTPKREEEEVKCSSCSSKDELEQTNDDKKTTENKKKPSLL